MGTDNKRKAPVLVILRYLAKWWLAYSIPPPTLSLKVLSALFCTVYWSPKTVPWLPAKYICYYGNQSKQGNWKKNRGRLKTRLIWICGFEIKSVEVCWCFRSSCTAQICKLRISVCVSFFHLYYILFFFRYIFYLTLTQRWNAFIREHTIKYLPSRAEPYFTLIHPLTDSLTVSRISLMLLNTLVHVNGFQSQTAANTLFTHFKTFWLPVCGFWLLLSACWF